MKIFFDHERLQAYQRSLEFIRWSESILDRVPKASSVYNQLDRARTSIPLNIAEGNAKFTAPDKCKFFDIAHGSAVECAACLDVLFLKQVLNPAELEGVKEILGSVVAMLIGLIKSKSGDRFSEDCVQYRAGVS